MKRGKGPRRFSQRPREPRAKEPTKKTSLLGILLKSAPLAALLWAIYAGRPSLTVEFLSPLDVKQPFSGFFVITNVGAIPAYDVHFQCIAEFGGANIETFSGWIEPAPWLHSREPLSRGCLFKVNDLNLPAIMTVTADYGFPWLPFPRFSSSREFVVIEPSPGTYSLLPGFDTDRKRQLGKFVGPRL